MECHLKDFPKIEDVVFKNSCSWVSHRLLVSLPYFALHFLSLFLKLYWPELETYGAHQGGG